ncbi:MAG: FliH/SctL family protein [Verrucomicrobiota bacterium]
MKSSPDKIHFQRPPKDVRIAIPGAPADLGRQLQEREEAAFERGRRAGEKALSEQLLRQRAELLELQNGVLQSLRQLLPQLAKEYESTLVTIALEAAQKVMAGLPVTAELVEATVREALERVDATSELTVLLHAEDLELLQRANSPLLVSEIGGEKLRLQGGREVTRGGCIVQTRFGTIDGRRETKLQLLRESLGS